MSSETVSGTMTKAMIDQLLTQPVLARMATTNPKTLQPHVVPVWFEWDGECIWISAFRSTRKIRELEANSAISILIDIAESGTDFRAVLFEGKAELVKEPQDFLVERTTSIYTRYLGPAGVLAPDPQSWIHDQENLLVKLTPTFTRAWYSSSKQTV